MRQFELVERVKSYDPGADEDLLNRAYVFAMKVHGSQVRHSGDSYFSHPLEVAGILTNYRLDCATIVAALLHDTVEDTDTTLDDIRKLFGQDVANLVDGVTKLNRLQISSDHAKQAENFRKLLIAMSKDIRVLLIKLADRLHNMRTLRFIDKPEKRRRIANETLDIYTPLAERIGMAEIKTELEDLAFAETQPEAREAILTHLSHLRDEGSSVVNRIMDQLVRTLRKHDLKAEVSGREKTAYSIWRKMGSKNISMEKLTDILAFRIIVDSVEECYRALGFIHAAYPMIPDRFKDYISTPKPNKYQSLHTAVIGPERQRIEVQIRTREMHEISELGVAAHWSYKQGTPALGEPQYRWIRELLDILEKADSPEEFLENSKLEMYADQVFCFTPKGEVIGLPNGSTPVDFAYAVHTEIGDHCVSAKINGRIVPLHHLLRNGDQVEIGTSRAQTPNPDWEVFVVTGKAKASIRRHTRLQRRGESISMGRQYLERAFRVAGHSVSDKALEGVLKHFRVSELDDLFYAIGENAIHPRDVITQVGGPIIRTKLPPIIRPAPPKSRSDAKSRPGIRGLVPNMAMSFAKCCHPLPGDRIVGIVVSGRGVTVHTIDCEQLVQYNNESERWLDLSWDDDAGGGTSHVGRLEMNIRNDPGALAAVTSVVAKGKGMVRSMKTTLRRADFCDMIIDVEVSDLRHLTSIISSLKASSAVHSVVRARH
ncbi:bifunctional (p)ppGpp synthetase/guanosine-3',5'-bis(diphosphate) 3'-pyrophosphohydrolase [Phaeovibrio sulfidiphilus]|uniref:GTP pyrophosphokinase rsh n=1 Tax=Phaeovibrio sulfidiphilus TaxID=1220600 RepID=A0A8J6YH84_9PROT|nr:bifunctional (p)ppGpp synthetase/guanosine-3',5'-bis(diphosphate) 3'-pyrophosphohydrolase [Phaeovibrio sulfidiphilus]MBE1236261.1 bifunctional (p)ppGpp synthetase/guanosine-3',5'-bis(diphosphate) 3'-pyrophosphohydrolase [Phaeovibrio sulfidiphilus]